MANLETTNLLLGIMAAVSVLEALVLVVLGVGAWRAYKRLMETIDVLEHRHIAPTMARINAILDDAKDVSAKVRAEANRVDTAIHTTMDRIDDTADRVRSTVRARTNNIVGYVKGVRAAIEAMLRYRPQSSEL